MRGLINGKNVERLWFWLKPLVVTCVAVSLTYVLLYDISTLSVFAPMRKAVDFRFSDLYNTVTDSRPQAVVSDDVTIVSVDGCNRQQLAQVLDVIDCLNPSTVALDVFMPSETIYDEELAVSIKCCENIVLPYDLQYDVDSGEFSRNIISFFDGDMDDKAYGVVNLSVSSVRDVVREFRPYFDVDGKRIGNFMVETARLSAPEKVSVLERRALQSEIIYYPSVLFEVINAIDLIGDNADISSLKEYVAGRNILIGKINDERDRHMTPVDADMPGILIHAHILDTILNERYITVVPRTANMIVSVLVCYMFMLVTMYITRRMSKLSNVVIRITQFVFMSMIGFVGCLSFLYANLYVDFSLVLVLIAIRAIASDVWMGVVICVERTVQLYDRCRRLLLTKK